MDNHSKIDRYRVNWRLPVKFLPQKSIQVDSLLATVHVSTFGWNAKQFRGKRKYKYREVLYSVLRCEIEYKTITGRRARFKAVYNIVGLSLLVRARLQAYIDKSETFSKQYDLAIYVNS